MENYEINLFKTANKLRGKISPSDYKFYVLPLVFIRYMSEKNHTNVWMDIVKSCEDNEISIMLDEELCKIIPNFGQMKNPYENIYSESNLPNRTIKDLICLINEIDVKNHKEKIDYLGRIYEYFIGNFAATEGNRGGEFFTPPSVVELLVQMLKPQGGIVYDPACGTGGMFVQSNKYSKKNTKFIGQEQNHKTIILAYMNAILHGLDLQIENGDTLLDDHFNELKADYIISNPPFNMKDWGAEQLSLDDPRIFGAINKNNANYMWVQHFIYHLKDTGKAGFVISNGALTSSNEADLFTRKKMLEQNVIDCVVQLPDKMFLGTAIPSALIFIDMARGSKDDVLFIDASCFGESISKTQKALTKSDILQICKLYHDYRDENRTNYNEKGLSWIVKKSEIINNDCKIMPSIYTGVKENNIDPAFVEKEIEELKIKLTKQMEVSSQISDLLFKELITI